MVTLWKKQLLEGAEMLFEKPGKDTEQHELEQKQDEMYKRIGKLQIENDFLKKVQTIVRDRTAAIEPDHPGLSIREQCRILGITRASYYYNAVEKDEDRALAITRSGRRISPTLSLVKTLCTWWSYSTCILVRYWKYTTHSTIKYYNYLNQPQPSLITVSVSVKVEFSSPKVSFGYDITKPQGPYVSGSTGPFTVKMKYNIK